MPNEKQKFYQCRRTPPQRVWVFTHSEQPQCLTAVRVDRIDAWKVSCDKDLSKDGLFLDLEMSNGESFSFLLASDEAVVLSAILENLIKTPQ
jgi:hypothetical protein